MGDLDGGDVQRGFAVILVNDPDAEFTIGWQLDAWMDFAVGIGVEDHVGGWDGGFGGQLGDVLLSAPDDISAVLGFNGNPHAHAGVVAADDGCGVASEDAAVDADTIADLDWGWFHGIIWCCCCHDCGPGWRVLCRLRLPSPEAD